MPQRKLPYSNAKRYRALRVAKTRKDLVPPPLVIPFLTATITRLDTFYPQYKTKFLAVANALSAQTTLTAQVDAAEQTAKYFIWDFLDAVIRATRRGTFEKTVLNAYHLALENPRVPALSTEQEIIDWGDFINEAETTRIAGGGTPVGFPTLAQVNGAVNNFNTLNGQQAAVKEAYDTAQEELEALNPEADKLILKLWNEIEAAFDEGDKPSMRRKAREWGVVYVPLPGEAPSPEEFSIVGKVTTAGSGTGIDEVEITVAETGATTTTLGNGDYFIDLLPPGTYNLQFSKAGYASTTISGVNVVAGVITTLNVQLTPVGTVQGTVLQGGLPVPAIVSIAGFPMLNTTTDPSGNYTIIGVPAGLQSIRAEIQGSSPPNFQTQSVTVPHGGGVTVDFSFV